MRDLYSNIAALPALTAAVQSAAATGSVIDLKNAKAVAFVLNTGAIVSSGDFGVTIQESDTTTLGDFADADAAHIQTDAPATLAANASYRLGYVGFKRYVRLSLSKAGGTSIAAGASAVTIPLDRPVA
ncbi:hypothetical protein DL1_11425 [Thioclava dalianensis]|uniref:Uncharacterized protein n=1 Tax=Thioclava dalianensis TaxID=1185766 RepID=A0A074TA00_9RHOB|nr:hypothetical protein [Thioclava dalianensis]KEP68529.1 hypothetical protein DL1_11425 [Thioclava dalianensis]SFN83936.1 hypothetical protein SAMN05216224_11712 [Thioclava dalianensis]